MSEVREEGVSEEGADAGVNGAPVTGHDEYNMHLHEGGVEGIISTMIECGMTGRYRLSIYERCEGTVPGWRGAGF